MKKRLNKVFAILGTIFVFGGCTNFLGDNVPGNSGKDAGGKVIQFTGTLDAGKDLPKELSDKLKKTLNQKNARVTAFPELPVDFSYYIQVENLTKHETKNSRDNADEFDIGTGSFSCPLVSDCQYKITVQMRSLSDDKVLLSADDVFELTSVDTVYSHNFLLEPEMVNGTGSACLKMNWWNGGDAAARILRVKELNSGLDVTDRFKLGAFTNTGNVTTAYLYSGTSGTGAEPIKCGGYKVEIEFVASDNLSDDDDNNDIRNYYVSLTINIFANLTTTKWSGKDDCIDAAGNFLVTLSHMQNFISSQIYVDSNAAQHGPNGTSLRPFATLKAAFDYVDSNVAGKAYIHIKDGHEEDFDSVKTFTDDIEIECYKDRVGDKKGRAVLKYSGNFDTDDTWPSNIEIAGITFDGSGQEITGLPFSLEAGNITFENVEFKNIVKNNSAVSIIKTTNTPGVKFINCSITGCTLKKKGALLLDLSGGNIEIDSITIKDNKMELTEQGDVYSCAGMCIGQNANVKMRGKIVIKDNTYTDSVITTPEMRNIINRNYAKPINISGPILEGSEIHITSLLEGVSKKEPKVAEPIIFASGWKPSYGAARNYFKSDTDFAVAVSANGKNVQLALGGGGVGIPENIEEQVAIKVENPNYTEKLLAPIKSGNLLKVTAKSGETAVTLSEVIAKLYSSSTEVSSSLRVQTASGNTYISFTDQNPEDSILPGNYRLYVEGKYNGTKYADWKELVLVANDSFIELNTAPVSGSTYTLASAESIKKFGEKLGYWNFYENVTFELVRDIVLPSDFKMISNGNYFKGTFDGKGKTITFTGVDTTAANVAFFYGLESAVVKNLTFAGEVNTTMDFYVLAANCESSEIKNCVNRCNVTSSGTTVSGFVNLIKGNSNLHDCINYGNLTVTGNSCKAAGFFIETKFTSRGGNGRPIKHDLINYGDIKSTGNSGKAAGICIDGGDEWKSYNFANHGDITAKHACGGIKETGNYLVNCYNTGNIQTIDADGLAGGISAYSVYQIINCYNTGAINFNKDYSGSIAGTVNSNYTEIINCWNAGSIGSGTGTICGVKFENSNMCKATLTNTFYLASYPGKSYTYSATPVAASLTENPANPAQITYDEVVDQLNDWISEKDGAIEGITLKDWWVGPNGPYFTITVGE